MKTINMKYSIRNVVKIFFIFLIILGNSTTIGIIVFDNVPTGEVTGPAEVFGRTIKKDWFQDGSVLLINLEKQPTVKTNENLVLSVDTNIYNSPLVDVLIVPGGSDTDLPQMVASSAIKPH